MYHTHRDVCLIHMHIFVCMHDGKGLGYIRWNHSHSMYIAKHLVCQASKVMHCTRLQAHEDLNIGKDTRTQQIAVWCQCSLQLRMKSELIKRQGHTSSIPQTHTHAHTHAHTHMHTHTCTHTHAHTYIHILYIYNMISKACYMRKW